MRKLMQTFLNLFYLFIVIYFQWPTDGNIEVSNLTVKYSQDALPVLHDISFVVNSGEKIGIVGRLLKII